MTLSTMTKVLHSIIALSMISLIAVGIFMHETKAYELYPIHKSFGVLVFLFASYRVVVRLKEGWPTPVGKTPAVQLIAAKLVHWALLIATVLYPVTGMMMSGAGGHGIPFFGLELVASNYDDDGKAVAFSHTIASLGHDIHGSLTRVLIAIIVLHVMGALKHHFVDKDETNARMFSFKK